MTPSPQLRTSPGGPAPTPDERTWALVAHLSGLVAAFIGPLVVMLTKGSESAWVRAQAVEALNFQLTAAGAIVVAVVVALIPLGFMLSFCMLPVVGLLTLVFTIIAAVKCYGGESYRYPINVRLVK